MLPVILLASAQQDLHDIQVWYFEHPEVYARLRLSLLEIGERIASQPYLYVNYKQSQYRIATVKHLPYRVLYRVKTDMIEIIAIVHTSQQPRSWEKRI